MEDPPGPHICLSKGWRRKSFKLRWVRAHVVMSLVNGREEFSLCPFLSLAHFSCPPWACLCSCCGYALTHPYHPKSILYIGVHSQCCIFSEFGWMYKDMYTPWHSIMQSSFATINILCPPPIHLFLPPNSWQPLIFLPSPQIFLFQNVI